MARFLLLHTALILSAMAPACAAEPADKDDKTSSVEELAKKVRPLHDEDLKAVNKQAILVRMLHNLLNVAEREKDQEGMLRYLSAILAVAPDAAQQRGMRAFLRHKTGDRDGALQDVDWLLEHPPEGMDVEALRAFRRLLTKPEN